jgi:hypothetical protein
VVVVEHRLLHQITLGGDPFTELDPYLALKEGVWPVIAYEMGIGKGLDFSKNTIAAIGISYFALTPRFS